MRFPLLCLWALALVIASGVHAHDYWLEPKPESVAPGSPFTVHLLVGDRLNSELERPLQHEMTTRYEWHTAKETIDLLQAMPDSTFPVFEGREISPGLFLLVMDRKFYSIDTTVRGFLDFLEHEEQQELGALYEEIDPETPLTRRYARAIKTLVKIGTPSKNDLHKKMVGQTVEIRILQNPHTLKPGTPIDVRVQFEANDLPGQLVNAFVRENDGTVTVQKDRTDDAGRAQFVLDRSGQWMIRVTYLRQCDNCDTDWDTYYATFSFVYP